ncbi:Non-specific serine/threonine protein kinase protein [Dioscorea alata]|uniref:Non-specific serine/threonine protein kinase protein n=1 Tax=Dioscorea alata TaxID=55571 RepID=A0ACB7USD0_DIOAL|nr:Non-specific serine/threonine protein kinase protein [Dioscorea alata]
MNQWQNTPPTWGQSDDPCGTPWEGVVCKNSRVIALRLSTMGIKGTLSDDLSQLSELQSLDLSFNNDLIGTLTPNIGKLKKLTTLILSGCGFTGKIPQELGTLPHLSFLALSSNKFSGAIPASLGSLSNLYWLDLADNQLSGQLPVSSGTSPGLDLLTNTKHFHFNKNRLSGTIPASLFNSNTKLIHLILDGNNFSGSIPSTIGLVQTLEVLRLGKNRFNGTVPSSISNLTSLNELNLANNNLTGAMPDLTGMNNLVYVDLSNNTFIPSEAPKWFSTIQSLITLVISSGGLRGVVPRKLFSFPQLQQVILDNNAFNGTLDITNISPQLQAIDFQNNEITSVTLNSNYNGTLILVGNPVCNANNITVFCHLQKKQLSP